MAITFAHFAGSAPPRPVIISSLDQALYQVLIVINGVETLLLENNGRPFRRHSLNEVREALQNMPIASLVLRQQSAYDEMIGQPVRRQDNTLEVPLSMELYPPVTTH